MSINSPTTTNFLNKFINNILLIVIAVLPISNAIGQVLTNGLKLNSNVLLWKEVLIAIAILLMLIQIIRNGNKIKLIYIPLFVLLCIIVGYSTIFNGITMQSILIGFRFELFWVMFLCFGYDWLGNNGFLEIKKLIGGIYFGVIGVVLLTITSIVVGSQNLYTFLNYKEGLEGVNKVSSLFCHSIDATGAGCRLSGGFNNPNHFASYLVLVIPVIAYYLVNNKNLFFRIANFVLLINLIIFSFLNYSRFAWLSLGITFIIFIINLIQNYNIKLRSISKIAIGLTISISFFVSFVIFLLPFNSTVNNQLPYFLSKPGSTETHHKLTNIAKDIIINNLPNSIYAGYGLGQSGPAAKSDYVKVEELKIVKENVAIADKYLIYPVKIPITENWYLQLILNGGLIYFIIYCFIVFRPIKELFSNNQLNFYLALSIFGIIFGNLFLHLWESSVTALYFSLITLIIYQNKKTITSIDN